MRSMTVFIDLKAIGKLLSCSGGHHQTLHCEEFFIWEGQHSVCRLNNRAPVWRGAGQWSNWLETRNLYPEKLGHIRVFLFDSKSDIISHFPQNIIIPDFFWQNRPCQICSIRTWMICNYSDLNYKSVDTPQRQFLLKPEFPSSENAGKGHWESLPPLYE